jgi:hypothetical protein
LAKIAVELESAGTSLTMTSGPAHAKARVLADGDSWTFEDVICTCGPRYRPLELLRANVPIAIVAGGISSIARHAAGRPTKRR